MDRLAGVVRISDTFERQRALMDLIDTLGPAEFAGVADQFRELDHLGDSRSEYALILRGWAKADPLTALEYVGQHPGGERGRGTILSTWAGNDVAAAERWALDHHVGDGPNPYLASVIRGIAGNDVAEASRLAQTLPQSRERGDAVDAITRALFLQGNDAAMAFPASITDPALRGGFVAAIADRLIGKDVNQAAAWVASMAQGDIQNRAARSVADALAKEDTKAAAAWVRTLKPEAQAEAARGVIPAMSRDVPRGHCRDGPLGERSRRHAQLRQRGGRIRVELQYPRTRAIRRMDPGRFRSPPTAPLVSTNVRRVGPARCRRREAVGRLQHRAGRHSPPVPALTFACFNDRCLSLLFWTGDENCGSSMSCREPQ